MARWMSIKRKKTFWHGADWLHLNLHRVASNNVARLARNDVTPSSGKFQKPQLSTLILLIKLLHNDLNKLEVVVSESVNLVIYFAKLYFKHNFFSTSAYKSGYAKHVDKFTGTDVVVLLLQHQNCINCEVTCRSCMTKHHDCHKSEHSMHVNIFALAFKSKWFGIILSKYACNTFAAHMPLCIIVRKAYFCELFHRINQPPLALSSWCSFLDENCHVMQ